MVLGGAVRKLKPKNCKSCGDVFEPTGSCQKFCANCKDLQDKLRMKEYHQKTYVRKGYNQFRENNNNWKGGIGVYRQIKKAEQCEECGSKENLCIHHEDENRYNNSLENLRCLCRRCHQIHHRCWEVLPKDTWLSILKSEQARAAKRDKKGKFTT